MKEGYCYIIDVLRTYVDLNSWNRQDVNGQNVRIRIVGEVRGA